MANTDIPSSLTELAAIDDDALLSAVRAEHEDILLGLALLNQLSDAVERGRATLYTEQLLDAIEQETELRSPQRKTWELRNRGES